MLFRPSELIAEAALALQFLTRLPVGGAGLYTPARWERMPRCFALAGLVIGLAAAGLLTGASLILPGTVAVWSALAGVVLLTGGLHEDGLADSADGLGGGRGDRARMLAIMRDSRIGSYGVLSLILAFGLQAASLTALPVTMAAGALVLAHSLSRGALALALAQGRYLHDRGAPSAGKLQGGAAGGARDGVGTGLGRSLTLADSLVLGLSLVCAGLIGAALGLSAGTMAAMTLASAATGAVWLGAARRRLGGDTGDILGALQMITATAALMAATAWP